MNSKKIVTIGLIVVLLSNVLYAKSHKKRYKEEVRLNECTTVKLVKGAGIIVIEGGCSLLGGIYGAAICGGIISVTEDKVGQVLARKLCD